MRQGVSIAGLLGIVLSGCGGGAASAPTAPSPAASVPAISTLTAAFSTSSCIRAADGLTGRALVITFAFTDAAGDVSGGRVQLHRDYNTGRSETHFFAVPTEVAMSGTATTGQIRIGNACPLYLDATSSTETISLFDANGHASNALSATVTRPAGAP